MSEKSKLNRARRSAKQEEQAKSVIKWIFAVLILIAIAWVMYIGVML